MIQTTHFLISWWFLQFKSVKCWCCLRTGCQFKQEVSSYFSPLCYLWHSGRPVRFVSVCWDGDDQLIPWSTQPPVSGGVTSNDSSKELSHTKHLQSQKRVKWRVSLMIKDTRNSVYCITARDELINACRLEVTWSWSTHPSKGVTWTWIHYISLAYTRKGRTPV